jgi:hypothetical protein
VAVAAAPKASRIVRSKIRFMAGFLSVQLKMPVVFAIGVLLGRIVRGVKER